MNIRDRLIEKLEGCEIFEVFTILEREFSNKIIFTTSLSAEDQIILNELNKLNTNIKVVTLDTGRLFPETYELIQKNEARFKKKIDVYFPNNIDVEKMVNEHGINLFFESVENRKLCCNVRKVNPLKRALAGYEIWINGLRKEQAETRKDLQIAEYDKNLNIIKINPLYNWTEGDVWAYIKENKIPYNNLHDKNYPSIGCQPCTRAISEGEDIRAGRWWWENPETKECGLHKIEK